jgi:hypothetical protein
MLTPKQLVFILFFLVIVVVAQTTNQLDASSEESK